MPLTSQNCTIHDLREAAEYGCTLPCRVCGEPVAYADAVTSTELDDVFCSEGCRDKREEEYALYIERAAAQAAREFRARSIETERRHNDYNAWAAQVSAA